LDDRSGKEGSVLKKALRKEVLQGWEKEGKTVPIAKVRQTLLEPDFQKVRTRPIREKKTLNWKNRTHEKSSWRGGKAFCTSGEEAGKQRRGKSSSNS